MTSSLKNAMKAILWLAYRNVVVAVVRCVGLWVLGRGRKNWYECVRDDMKALGLHPE